MVPLSIFMRKEKQIHMGLTRGQAISAMIHDRRKWYGVIPLCERCQRHCKQANAPGLLQFLCERFLRKGLTSVS